MSQKDLIIWRSINLEPDRTEPVINEKDKVKIVFQGRDLYVVPMENSDFVDKHIDRGIILFEGIACSSDHLEKLIYSSNLEKIFQEIIYNNAQISWFFFKQYFSIPQDKQKGSASTKKMENFFHSLGLRYYDLWLLIDKAFHKIKNYLPESFASPEDLFLKIVKYERSCFFEACLENPYIRTSRKNMIEVSKNYQIHNPSNEDCEAAEKLLPEFMKQKSKDNPLNRYVLPTICKKITSKGDPKIKFLFQRFMNNKKEVYYHNQVLLEARDNNGRQRSKDFVWKENN